MTNHKTQFVFLTKVRNSKVVDEIIKLTSNHTGIDETHHLDETDNTVVILIENNADSDVFLNEFLRLEKIVREPLNEPILPDNYPMYCGYMYVINGRPRQFLEAKEMSVGRFKTDPEIREVRSCDLSGRMLRAPLIKTDNGLDVRKSSSVHLPHHGPRKRHKTYKIRNA